MKQKQDYIKGSVNLLPDQSTWIRHKAINLSQYVRNKISEDMEKEPVEGCV